MGRPPIGPRAMTGAERVQRHRARLRGNASTSPDHGDLELARQRAENAALLRDVALGDRFAGSNRNRPAKPKAPPLPPDEQRYRQIKALKTANASMRRELHDLRTWCRTSGVPDRGGMTFQTHGKIMKALHTDRRPSEAEREEACKAFAAWVDSLKRWSRK